eukprot:TRINITY_DN12072_c0_g1_i1.p1 TRINITY_DN12072_c0_g1~~TRINITY_DN12072_c0_g1_i1.p1  ORF type:complete len:286 (-),score=108.24 TRINITY_DN12072_c0_g1_i1:21-878(-)
MGSNTKPTSIQNGISYKVELGNSFTDPNSKFHVVNYNFKPASLASLPEGVAVKSISSSENGKSQNSTLELEFSSKEDPSNVSYFKGKYQTAKEVECVLIYEEGKGFIIEKVSGSGTLIKQQSGSISSALSTAEQTPSPIIPNLPTNLSKQAQKRAAVSELNRQMKSTKATMEGTTKRQKTLPSSSTSNVPSSISSIPTYQSQPISSVQKEQNEDSSSEDEDSDLINSLEGGPIENNLNNNNNNVNPTQQPTEESLFSSSDSSSSSSDSDSSSSSSSSSEDEARPL